MDGTVPGPDSDETRLRGARSGMTRAYALAREPWYNRTMQQINVLGTELQPCSVDPMTGYYRTGCCENRGDDPGMHVVCCRVTDDFLEFSRQQGNDLSTPMPQFGFAGLADGDQWCVCADRWAEALTAGRACPVVLESTHVSALEYVDLDDLKRHAG